MEGFKVRCQTCGQVLYETTTCYNCHKPLAGDMLKLLPLYKDWPTYDGSLACKSTSRFLMFCSQCSGYISTTGKLMFADFPDVKVTEISEDRSRIGSDEDENPLFFWKRKTDTEYGEELSSFLMEAIDNSILPNAEDSALSDDLQKADSDLMTPEEK